MSYGFLKVFYSYLHIRLEQRTKTLNLNTECSVFQIEFKPGNLRIQVIDCRQAESTVTPVHRHQNRLDSASKSLLDVL
jgi:hypothetical protein